MCNTYKITLSVAIGLALFLTPIIYKYIIIKKGYTLYAPDFAKAWIKVFLITAYSLFIIYLFDIKL